MAATSAARRRLLCLTLGLMLAAALVLAFWHLGSGAAWGRASAGDEDRRVATAAPLQGKHSLHGSQPGSEEDEPDAKDAKDAGVAEAGSRTADPRSDSHSIDTFLWRTVTTHYPVATLRPLPPRPSTALPKIQHASRPETPRERDARLARRRAVRATFARCWAAYRSRAFGHDEVSPVGGEPRDPYGGWGATLVDALDTLWIMGMRDDFADAATEAARIDFTVSRVERVNVFETNIRILGGLLSAYDLSGDERLLDQARDVGDMLYKAFDTPTRMIIPRWDFAAAACGDRLESATETSLAELGTFVLEFTRLSILTDDAKYFDAIQRITEALAAQQETTRLPGLWPVIVDTRNGVFDQGADFSLGGMADSMYEYLVKMVALVGDTLPVYKKMYVRSMEAAREHLFFRVSAPDQPDVLFSGIVRLAEKGQPLELEPTADHLACFTGGMLTIGGKMLANEEHVELGRKLTLGCVWAYAAFPNRIMPESSRLLPCNSTTAACPWVLDDWHAGVLHQQITFSKLRAVAPQALAGPDRLPHGFTSVPAPGYFLRPEAIESVFVLYRATGDRALLDVAWDMWAAIDNATATELASSALRDVTGHGDPEKVNSMESFWFGETLKYFYLMFSEPELISLDEYVFNTEGHPLKRSLPP